MPSWLRDPRWRWLRPLPARILQYALVIFAAAVINFALPRLAPGSPVDFLVPPEMAGVLTAEQRTRLLAQYGLDQPLAVQFKLYLTGLLHGDFFTSVRFGQPVADLIAERLPWTLLLVGSSTLLAVLIGTWAGFHSGWRRGSKRDAAALGLFMLLDSTPVFFVGMLLILLFSVHLRWFPAFGAMPLLASGGWALLAEMAQRLALPLLTSTLSSLGVAFLVARSAMVSELGEDYVFLGHVKLAPERVRAHAARNALLPVWTNAMLALGYMVGGATVVETVFSYPGLGRLIYESVIARDYPVIQGGFFVLTLTVVAANFIADLFYPLFDPRLRRAGAPING